MKTLDWRKPLWALGAALLALAPLFPAMAQAAGQYPFKQDYEPSPAIWRLADEDTTIYLFGTIHILPEGFKWRSAELDAIVAEVDELIVETTDKDAEKDIAALSGKLEKIYAGKMSISNQLPARLRDKWALFTSQNAEGALMDQAPLLLGILSMFMAGAEEDVSRREHGVETVLEAEFAASGRPIGSIEAFPDILLSLYRNSDKQAIRDLGQELDRWNGKGPLFPDLYLHSEDADFWAMEHAWAKGDVGEDIDLGLGDGKLGQRFRRILLEDRNRAWAGWLEKRLEQPGKVLVAVGAGHFDGHDAVQVMLEERGLRAERIH